jgi:hypothetical protein
MLLMRFVQSGGACEQTVAGRPAGNVQHVCGHDSTVKSGSIYPMSPASNAGTFTAHTRRNAGSSANDVAALRGNSARGRRTFLHKMGTAKRFSDNSVLMNLCVVLHIFVAE